MTGPYTPVEEELASDSVAGTVPARTPAERLSMEAATRTAMSFEHAWQMSQGSSRGLAYCISAAEEFATLSISLLDLRDLLANHTALIERIEILAAALRPFSEFATFFERVCGNTPSSGPFYAVETTRTGPLEITVEDFRAAQSALNLPADGALPRQDMADVCNVMQTTDNVEKTK